MKFRVLDQLFVAKRGKCPITMNLKPQKSPYENLGSLDVIHPMSKTTMFQRQTCVNIE